MFSSFTLTCLVLLTSVQPITKPRLKEGYYVRPPFGHVISFYKIKADRVYLYTSNVGTWYGAGKYELNLADSTLEVHYSQTYYSKHPYQNKNSHFEPLQSEKLLLGADSTGSLIIKDLSLSTGQKIESRPIWVFLGCDIHSTPTYSPCKEKKKKCMMLSNRILPATNGGLNLSPI